MKYQQPYGISDPNAPYINGNPSTGTMGSIPPAKSIEDPQREMHNFIEKSFLTPQEADLQQIAKAVQSGQVVYSLDGGEVNKIVITPPVALGAYRAGQRFVIKMSYASTSQVTVNVSGLGQRPLIHTDLSPMNPFELIAGQIVEVAYDGSNFQLVAGGAPGGIVTLKGTSTVYVNDGTGSDTLYDGTQPAPIGVMGGPFKTIQKALSTMQKYNLGGQYFNIMVADGVYANAGPVNFPMPNGSGWVQIIGNISNPSAVSIFNTGTGSCWYIREGGNYAIHGVIFRATAPRPGDNGCGVWLGAASFVVFGDCHWNNMGHNGTTWTGAGIQVGPGGYGFVVGDQTIKGSCSAHHTAFGNGVCYVNCGNADPYDDPALIIANPVTIVQGFAVSAEGGATRPMWQPTGTGITNPGFVTGPKYLATSNGTIQVAGRGVNYLPGTVAGSTSLGGQYV